MSHKDNELEDHDKDNVSIRISDEVIASIAGVAAAQVEGVAAMSGNLMSDIGDVFLGKKSGGKGVKVASGQEEVELDLYINVKYGARIPEVAYKVQENVKKSVESMTDLRVTRVNIHIQGISQSSNGDE
ncbi:MAG TPA: Asp23/Gls24 family envelope stress response protein [Bacillota bacterium]|nr:Asp23/Gls24 family envelope stress response protein [Candidatus Fermentithermobacillaceae bacterium]HOB30620.1 Asp23/Gls24 family envelope stress response protein [Bacillota bacterium]HOK64486.1 Asp23/Gls24 family envelope stress response protein [Bacillota bacterium]HOL11772.1 Asp23/Gls24 family envelope stress response protein [Bacillota bacterium]HOQ02314.1 Asp23/Gls24 family envelope stress response protein [Bacillota bacterium]